MSLKKDIKISNMKGLLIFLVVFGHLIEVYKYTYYDLYSVIYSFHMPLFIIISGYLAKNIDWKKIINFLLLYLIFQTIFNLVYSVISPQFDYTIPYFHLWYLVSMGTWYILAYPLTKKQLSLSSKLIVLSSALIISLLSRYIVIDGLNNYFLSYQRSLSYLFFFFLGFILNTKDIIQIYSLIKNKLFTWAILFVIVGLIHLVNNEDLELIFRGAFNVSTSNLSGSQYFIQITFGYLISVFMCFIISNLVTNRTSYLTKWGDNSLYIFIFHAFFVIPFQLFPSLLARLHPLLILVGFGLLSLFVTTLLSSGWFIKYTNKICNPYKTISKYFRKDNMSSEQTVR